MIVDGHEHELFLRSFVVSFGASTIAVLVAAALALATFGRGNRTARIQSGLVSSLLLLPSYVTAGAWSAGFGSMGWWTLSQVTSAKAPLVGIASVVWIHAMAATPIAYWLLIIGLRHCRSEPMQLSKMEGGILHQFRRGIWPNWSLWIWGTFLLIAAWISGDMVVSNLFQVPTLVEQCYLDMIAGQVTWLRIAEACGMSLVVGVSGFLLIGQAWHRERDLFQTSRWNGVPLGPSWIGGMVAWALILIVVGLPITNLTIRAGWIPKQTMAGTVERRWDVAYVAKNVTQSSDRIL